jgi:hypothetical protein
MRPIGYMGRLLPNGLLSPTKRADQFLPNGRGSPTKRADGQNDRSISGLPVRVSYQTGAHGQLPRSTSPTKRAKISYSYLHTFRRRG